MLSRMECIHLTLYISCLIIITDDDYFSADLYSYEFKDTLKHTFNYTFDLYIRCLIIITDDDYFSAGLYSYQFKDTLTDTGISNYT